MLNKHKEYMNDLYFNVKFTYSGLVAYLQPNMLRVNIYVDIKAQYLRVVLIRQGRGIG